MQCTSRITSMVANAAKLAVSSGSGTSCIMYIVSLFTFFFILLIQMRLAATAYPVHRHFPFYFIFASFPLF